MHQDDCFEFLSAIRFILANAFYILPRSTELNHIYYPLKLKDIKIWKQIIHAPLMDIKQAEVILVLGNYHTMEVWRSVKRYPELEYVRIGRKVKYRLSVLERFIERIR